MPTSGLHCYGAGTFTRERQSWFEQASEEQFLFCRFTQITVLRLLTTGQIMGKDTRSMSEAWSLWDRIWADDRVVFLPEPEDIDDFIGFKITEYQTGDQS
jgi:hypothetical protein